MQRFFITGTGTGIGKTLVTSALAWQLQRAGKKVIARKPVASGFSFDDEYSDPVIIAKSLGLPISNATIETITPWHFAAPLSPDMAAAKEETSLDFPSVVAFCRQQERQAADVVLVEGVGGIMAPLNNNRTVLDWIKALGWPVVLVSGSYLGALSHTLTALEVLRAHHVLVKALVISESTGQDVPLDDTVASLKRHMVDAIPIIPIPRIGISSQPWALVPNLQDICA